MMFTQEHLLHDLVLDLDLQFLERLFELSLGRLGIRAVRLEKTNHL